MRPLPLKNLNILPLQASVKQSVKVAGPYSGTEYDDQIIHGRINMAVTAQSQAFDAGTEIVEKRMIHVDLDGTNFGAPSNCLTLAYFQGWYLEWIKYQVWLQEHGTTPDPEKALTGWIIEREAPDTPNASGSISSSLSYGFNGSVGSFGNIATGNLGANLGVSSTHSHTITDFTFYQRSDANIMRHEIRMSSDASGNPYRDPYDLVRNSVPFRGIRMFDLPSLATSNVPVIGQALWMNTDNESLLDKLTIHLTITPNWAMIEGESDGLTSYTRQNALGNQFHYQVDADFGPILN